MEATRFFETLVTTYASHIASQPLRPQTTFSPPRELHISWKTVAFNFLVGLHASYPDVWILLLSWFLIKSWVIQICLPKHKIVSISLYVEKLCCHVLNRKHNDHVEGVRLRLWTAAANRPIVHTLEIWAWTAMVEWYWQAKTLIRPPELVASPPAAI
jgi:hypothetical protein